MQEDDVTLLRRYVEENAQEAFTQVVRRNMDAVYSAALRRVGGDAHLARDVAQDVFIALARHARPLSGYRVLSGWLFAATRNAAANRVRGEARRRRREEEAQIMHDVPQGRKDGGMDWGEVAPVLDRTMDELAERDRLAILLRFFDQRTFAEIGASLRITEDAARMRVDRALGKLQARLRRHGIRSSVAVLGAAMTLHAVEAAPTGLATAVAGSALTAPAPGWGEALGVSGLEAALVAGALLTIGGAFWVTQSAQQAAAAAAVDRVAEQNAIRRIEQRVHELEQRRPDPEPARAARPDAAPASVPGADRAVRLAGGRRTGLAAIYDPFYRALGLTPEQMAEFETIGVSGAGPAMWVFDQTATGLESTELSPAEIERRLRALLGENGYARYRDYHRAVPAREAVMQLAGAVYLTEPLDRGQGERLTALMLDASRDYQTGGRIDLAALDWDALTAAAREVLSPAQLGALAAVRQQAAFYGALQQRLAQRNPARTVSGP